MAENPKPPPGKKPPPKPPGKPSKPGIENPNGPIEDPPERGQQPGEGPHK